MANAQKFLNRAIELDPKSSTVWRMLAGVYHNQKNDGMFNLAMAEESNLQDKNEEARSYARKAKKLLQKNSPSWIRANDILADVKIKKDNEE